MRHWDDIYEMLKTQATVPHTILFRAVVLETECGNGKFGIDTFCFDFTEPMEVSIEKLKEKSRFQDGFICWGGDKHWDSIIKSFREHNPNVIFEDEKIVTYEAMVDKQLNDNFKTLDEHLMERAYE